ncbi:MAG TPA: protein-export chaperone SecB [Gammaproteobacteria bacterium]|nr:protein-export chaperone SecB [Gammaproteobacteria bacterium]
MADTTTPAATETAMSNGDRQVLLQHLYVKDCSFESPRSPTVFGSNARPDIKIDMHTNAQKLDDGSFEVVLKLTAEATVEERAVFLVEVQQAGLFTLSGFSEQEQAAILSTYCPNILFPYLREVVSDLTLKGGMMPLILQPVNFDALYAQRAGAQAAGDTAAN